MFFLQNNQNEFNTNGILRKRAVFGVPQEVVLTHFSNVSKVKNYEYNDK